jgi:hypothetical protein
MALAIAGCGGDADDTPTAAAQAAPTTTVAPAPSTTVPPTTSTTLRYGLLGEEVATSESALGTVTWWHVPSIPPAAWMTGEL